MDENAENSLWTGIAATDSVVSRRAGDGAHLPHCLELATLLVRISIEGNRARDGWWSVHGL
jgi:hypothetical protein